MTTTDRPPMTDIAAIAARCERARKAMEVGGNAGAFLCVTPICEDIPALLAVIATLRTALEEAKAALEPFNQASLAINQGGFDDIADDEAVFCELIASDLRRAASVHAKLSALSHGAAGKRSDGGE